MKQIYILLASLLIALPVVHSAETMKPDVFSSDQLSKSRKELKLTILLTNGTENKQMHHRSELLFIPFGPEIRVHSSKSPDTLYEVFLKNMGENKYGFTVVLNHKKHNFVFSSSVPEGIEAKMESSQDEVRAEVVFSMKNLEAS